MKHIHGGDIYRNNIILDYSANINPLGIPKKVEEAMIHSIKEAVHYPDTECNKLREAIAEMEGVKKESILCGNGAAELIYMACLALKPKKALLMAPTFAEYEQALKTVNCNIDYYLLKEEKEFQVEADYLSYLKPDIDIIFLCNPNNPTGQLFEKNLLLSILSSCKEKNIMAVIDECFIDFVENSEQYSMKEELEQNPNIFILKAFTKFFALPGIRLGYGFTSSKSFMKSLKEVVQPWSVSVIAQAAGIASCSEEEYRQASKALIQKEREFLTGELKKGLADKVFKGNANFIFIKASKEIYNGLKEKGIFLRDCSNYYGLEEGYYRLAVKSHKDNQILIQELKNLTA